MNQFNIILILLLLGSLLLIPATSPLLAGQYGFSDLNVTEQAEHILEQSYFLLNEGNFRKTSRYLNKLEDIIYDEVNRATDNMKGEIVKLTRKIIEFNYLVEEKIDIEKREFFALAKLTATTLLNHHNQRALAFKRRRLMREMEDCRVEVHNSRRLQDRWTMPARPDSLKDQVEKPFVAMTKGIVKTLGHGFTNFNNSIDTTMDISDSLKKREAERKEQRLWKK
jgi:hypothetical protein